MQCNTKPFSAIQSIPQRRNDIMMVLANDIHIQCSRCNHVFTISKDYYEPSILDLYLLYLISNNFLLKKM